MLCTSAQTQAQEQIQPGAVAERHRVEVEVETVGCAAQGFLQIAFDHLAGGQVEDASYCRADAFTVPEDMHLAVSRPVHRGCGGCCPVASRVVLRKEVRSF